jgi:hypothetical protein
MWGEHAPGNFGSPPALLISGGLFFLANHDPRGWILVALGSILAAELAERVCRNN